MNSAKRIKTCRNPSRNSSKLEVRKRLLMDLIQMAHIYQREGLLCNSDRNDDNYEEQAVKEFSVIAGINQHGAKRILKLVRVRQNEELWSFLKTCTMLSVFEEAQFTKSYASMKNGGGALNVDFLEVFVNGAECKYLQAKRKLDIVCNKYDPVARELCVTMFFKLVSVISTLSSYMLKPHALKPNDVVNTIASYLSPNWFSDNTHKQHKKGQFRVFLVDGWNIVNEVFKVQVQELLYWKERKCSESPNVEDISTKKNVTIRVDREDLKINAHRFCHQVISEFLAWCYQITFARGSPTQFWEDAVDVVDQVIEKLCQELGCESIEEVPEDLIISKLERIENNEPTLGELRYDAANIAPCIRSVRIYRDVVWNPRELVMRCRWEDSPAEKDYSTFIRAAEKKMKVEEASRITAKSTAKSRPEDVSTPKPEEVSKAIRERVPECPSRAVPDESVPGTPEPCEPEYRDIRYLFNLNH